MEIWRRGRRIQGQQILGINTWHKSRDNIPIVWCGVQDQKKNTIFIFFIFYFLFFIHSIHMSCGPHLEPTELLGGTQKMELK